MPVEISNDEMQLLNSKGIDQEAIKQTVDGYRAQGLKDEDIRGRLDRKLSELRPNPDKGSVAETLTDTAQGIYQGLTNGFADEMVGGINGAVYGIGDKITGRGDGTFSGGFERGYRQKRDEYRNELAQAQERSPIATGAGEIAGAIANPLTSKLGGGLIGKTTPLAKKLAVGAVVGAADGASYGAGKSTAGNMSAVGIDALNGGLYGAATGVAAPLALHGVERGVNSYKLHKAKPELLEMLGNQKGFDNVDFGILRQEKVQALNKIRRENGVDLLSKRRLTIPANVVKHLQDKRILTDGMQADDVADMLIDVFHSPKSVVTESKYPHIQAMVAPKDEISNVGFVGVNPANGDTVVKTAYKMANERAAKEFAEVKPSLDGRTDPSSLRSETPVAAARFSDLQQGLTNNILGSEAKVNTSRLTGASLPNNPNLTVAQKKAVAGRAEYEVLHNAKLQADSQIRLTSDFNGVKGSLEERLKRADFIPTAADFEDSRQLISRLFGEGREEEAVNLLESISRAGSKAGQSVQALSLWNKLTPEGAVLHAQRLVDRFNEQFPKKAIRLSEVQINKIRTLQKEVMRQIPGTREYDKAAALALKAQQEVIPRSFGQKLAAYRSISMLLNAKTLGRNIVGNVVFNGFEKGMVDPLAAGIDKLASLKTGIRTRVLPQLGEFGRGLAKGVKEGAEDARLGINTRQLGGKYDLQPQGAFEGKIGQKLEKLLNYGLQVPDRAFYEATLRESLENQMKAAKVIKPTNEMLKIAEEEALESVFQNKSVLSNAALGLRRGLNRLSQVPLEHMGIKLREGSLGAGDILMPFAQVPANLTQQAINYSPLGLVKGIGNLNRGFQRAGTKDLARGLIGTGAMGGAAELAKRDIITGDMNNGDLSYQQNLNRRSNLAVEGKRPFQINGVSYNMFSPLSTTLAAGAKFGQGGSKKEAVLSALESVVDLPFMQGVNRLFKTTVQQDIGTAVQNAVADIPAQFIPTLMSQIADVVNPSMKETYDPNILKQGLNKAMNKIPLVRDVLPDRVSVTGEKQRKYDSRGAALVWDAMINPTFVNQEKAHPVIDELERLYQESGEASQFLPIVKKKIRYTDAEGVPQNKILTARELTAYQKTVGQANVYFLDQLFQQPSYWQAPAEEKVKRVRQVQQMADELAKKALFGIGSSNPAKPAERRINALRGRTSKLRRGILRGQMNKYIEDME